MKHLWRQARSRSHAAAGPEALLTVSLNVHHADGRCRMVPQSCAGMLGHNCMDGVMFVHLLNFMAAIASRQM